MAAMVGGGTRARPGEVSLAHNGVLFLDELPEFTPQVLDSLRQPLEAGETVVARANHRVTYPSRIQLIAAMNPCRCGKAGEPGHTCRRGPRCAADYQGRISGPLLDRIDIRIEVPGLTAADLIRPGASETSADVALRVAGAREIQAQRFAQLGAPACAAMRRPAPTDRERGRRRNGPARGSGRRGRRDAVDGARLPSRAETGAHAGRPGRSGNRGAHPYCRGAELPGMPLEMAAAA
jgi:magnesium chelatase family protein